MSWSNLGICRGVAPSMGTFVERCTCPPSGPVKQAIQNRELGFRRRLDISVTILNDNDSRCQACLKSRKPLPGNLIRGGVSGYRAGRENAPTGQPDAKSRRKKAPRGPRGF